MTRITNQGWNPCKKLLAGLVTRGILVRQGNPRLERDGKAQFVLANNASVIPVKLEGDK